METLGISLIPLAAFWAAFNSMLKAAEFVNAIRDAVLSGMTNNATLSPNSRNAMFYDWVLAMIGTIFSSLTFSAIMIWMGQYIYYSDKDVPSVGIVIGLSGALPLFGAVLFILCGLSDYKAMKNELHN